MLINELSKQVGEWGLDNFGPGAAQPPFHLDYFSPLTGIGEELGELLEARLYSEIVDAIGDVQVYLCDFIDRTGLGKIKAFTCDGTCDYETVAVYYHRMQHICLKRAQGIRGYDDDKKFRKELHKATQGFYEAFTGYCRNYDILAEDALEDTWKEVSQRDWNKSKEHGDALSPEDVRLAS